MQIKNRKLLMILTFILVISSTIAYSALTSTLQIDAEAKLRTVSDIRVSGISLSSASGATLQYESSYDINTITSGFVLPTTDSSITYKVTVTNNGTIDQTIYDILTQSSNNSGLYYTISGYTVKDVIGFKTVVEFYITYKTTTPSNDVINVVNKFNFKKVYHVTFETKGGTSIPEGIKYEGVDLSLSTFIPTKQGYILSGWTDEQDGTTVKYQTDGTYTLDRDLILYAVWESDPNTNYSVNHYVHDLGTDTYTLNSTDNLTGETDSTLTLASLKKTIPGFTYVDGYLTGGTTKPTSGAVTTTTILADGSRVINLYYRRNYLYIQYHVNGGSMASNHGEGYGVSNSLVTYKGRTNILMGVYGSKVGPTNSSTYIVQMSGIHNYNNTINIEKNGYIGKSEQQWNTSSDGTGISYNQDVATYDANGFGGADLSTGDQVVTLYVNWVPVDYEIQYDLQGGTLSTTNPATYNIETDTFTLNNPTQVGYTFLGWTGSNGNTPQTTVTIPKGSTGDKAYIANWRDLEAPTLNLRKVTYKENDFSDWTLSNASIDSNGVLTIGADGNPGYAQSDFIDVNGDFYYNVFDGYSETAKPNSSNGGIYWAINYYDSNYQPTTGLDGKTGDGHAVGLSLNSWKNNIYWLNSQNDIDLWKDRGRYGENVKYVKIRYSSNDTYGPSPIKIRNLKIYGESMFNSFYLINVTSNDNVGIVETKYASGNQDASYFATGGTAVSNNQIRVTENGVYTVYVKDAAGNATVKTIEITNIKKEATFLPGAKFNAKIKQLAGDIDATHTTRDTNITTIMRYPGTPSQSILNNADIVSTSDSIVPIYAWFDNGTLYYYSETEHLYMNKDAGEMFYELKNVTAIDVSTINTSRTVNMSGLFNRCNNLETFDLSNFDTSSVVNMKWMFAANFKLQTINLSNFNTSNVTNMDGMFGYMSALVQLDLSNFNMTKVTNTTDILRDMPSLESLKTPKVYPTDTSVTITLPQTLYSVNGMGYTALDSTSPTETWLYKGYEIQYDLQGGTISTTNPATYNIETDTFTLNNPTQVGYTFLGWTGSNGTTPQTTVTIPKGSTGDKAYIANWQANTYNVTFDTNGGTIGANELFSFDGSTHTIDGTIVGATWGTDYLQFAGNSSSYVNLGQINSDYMTLQATFSIDEPATRSQIIMGSLEVGGASIHIESYSGEYVIAGQVRVDNSYRVISSDIVPEVGKKYNVLLSYDGKVEKLYINNVLIGTTEIEGVIKTPSSNTIMALGGNPYEDRVTKEYFKGKIYNASVYSNPKKQVTYNSPYGTLPTPTRNGYTFKGWNGKNLFNEESILMEIEGVTHENGYYSFHPSKADKAYGRITDNIDSYVGNKQMGINFKENTQYTISLEGYTDYIDEVSVYQSFHIGFFYTDGSKSFISLKGVNPQKRQITSEAGKTVSRIATSFGRSQEGNVHIKYIQLEEGETATEYEPYYVTSSTNVTQAKDHTLKAIWETVDYEITYDLQGGTLSTANPATYNIETNTITLNNPTQVGYTFTGWTGSNGNTPETTVTIPVGSTGAKAYIANWQANNYTLTFNANGGNVSTTTKQVTYGQTYTDLPTPTRSGYIFKGWYADLTGTSDYINMGRDYMYEDKISIHTSAYMDDWSTFNARIFSSLQTGGWGILPLSGNFRFACYDSGVGYKYVNTSTALASLSSGWHDFDLVFDGTNAKGYIDGTLVGTSETYVSGKIGYHATNSAFIGAEATASPTTPSGGNFIGNIGNIIIKNDDTLISGTTYNTITAPAQDLTLYARWESVNYNITYDLQGGTLSTTNPTTYNAETDTFTLNNPTQTGYTFTGWTGSNGNTPQTTVTITKGSYGDKAYIANWTPNTYTVIADGNDGNIPATTGWTITTNADSKKSAKKTVTYGSTYGTLPTPTRTGYTFGGWNNAIDVNDISITAGTSNNKNVVIRYNIQPGVTYTVTINNATLNSGTATNFAIRLYDFTDNIQVAKVTSTFGSNKTINITCPDTADATHKLRMIIYAGNNGSTANNIVTYTGIKVGTMGTTTATEYTSSSTVNYAGDHQLYALWEPINYEITYDLQSGSLSTQNPATYNIETGTFTLNNPTLEGHTFIGWTGSNGNTPETTVTIPKGSTGDKAYIANWQVNTYTITLNPNGGSVNPTTINLKSGDHLGILPTPTKTGFEFVGWYTDVSGTLVDSSTVPIASATLIAHYEPSITKGAIYNANGGKFDSDKSVNVVEYDESSDASSQTITKYSHTSNIDDTGLKSSNYGNSWTNTSIRGTDRTTSSSEAHVITIPGASELTVDLYYNGESVSYDWVSVWAGSYPNYTASSNRTSTGYVTTAMGAPNNNNKFGGSQSGSYTVNGNSLTNMGYTRLTIPGDSVTFSFKSNGSGSGKGYGYYAIVSATIKVNTENYKEPTRTGYTFNNWNTASDATGTAYTSEQDIINYVNTNNTALKLYADWIAKTYDITLNKNGATNSPTSSLTATYDSSTLSPSSITVPEKVYTTTINTTLDADRNSDGATITGDTTAKSITYTFDGWTTSANGGTKVINNSNNPALLSSVSGYTDSNSKWIKDQNTTLYAKWNSPVTTTVTLPKITKTNFKCGWTNVSTSDTIATINGTELNSEATFTPTGSYTLYPVCELDKYFELTYDANDGYFGYPVTTSPTTTNKVTYTKDGNTVTAYADGVKYREYKKPIRDGYRFDGWSTSKTATTPTYTDEDAAKTIVQTTGSATLYAVWTRVWAENLSYDNTNTGVNCSDAQCMLDYLATKLTNKGTTKFKVGDLVQMTPQNSSYTTMTKYTGYGSTQTINPKELKLWRIIRVNSNGTVDAVSEYVSSTNTYFSGTPGYQNFSGYLNKLASQYENPKYTVGSRIMGYNGQTEFISDTSYFDGTDLKAGEEWTSSTSGTSAEEYLGRGDELYQTDYDLVKAAYGNASDSAKANKVGTTTATYYWLGSRYYRWYSSTSFNFDGRTVNTDGYISSTNLRNYYYSSWYGSSWNDLSYSYALRPIITLRSGLTATGSGTSSDPYVLK